MNNSNDSSTNLTEIEFSPSFRRTASISYLILLILSLLINLFQLAVYIKGRKLFKSMAFFLIAWQMLFYDLIMLAVMIIFMSMVIVPSQPLIPEDKYFYLAFIESYAYNGLLLFAFLLTLNRLFVFALPRVSKYLFDRPMIYGTIFIFWILTTVLVVGIMYSQCPIIVKYEDMGFGSGCIDGEKTNMFNYIGQYVATYFPIVMIISYVLIYMEIKVGIFCNTNCCALRNVCRSNFKSSHNKLEIKLLGQAAAICSTFWIQNLCFTYLPYKTVGREFSFFAIMFSSIVLFSVDALVVLIFNSMVRRVAISFFKPDTNQTFNSQYRPSIVTSSTSQTRRTSFIPKNKY